jgi:uncharacterized protein (TIGR00299 family) protein
MRIAYLDCFSGVSGDMLLGALVDAGVSFERLEQDLRRLSLTGWRMRADTVRKRGIRATKVAVESEEHHAHRGLQEILGMISSAGFSSSVTERASRIFTRLGEAEAAIHDVPVERIHFHEVGAVDAIVDILGASIGFEMLGIEELTCSPLNVGGGQVKAEHGILPVPAPATAALLRGVPTYSSGLELELVTPTGAAIVTTLAHAFGAQPPMRTEAIGYGAGTADPKEQANVLRILVGESVQQSECEVSEGWDAPICVLETNIDDMNPQIYGYFAERALKAGALDMFATPVQMKKNRPGLLLTLLCERDARDRLCELLLRETTTIGVRLHEVRRKTLERETLTIDTPHGRIRIKVSHANGNMLNAAPEYEDCRRIAQEKDLPLKDVLAEALSCFHRQRVTRD